MSIEALATFVLKEVALDGDHGTIIPKLFEYVANFYRQHRQRRFRLDRLCDNTPSVLSRAEVKLHTPKLEDDSNFFPTQALDLELRKEIWKWLTKDPDFRVGKNNEGKDLGLEEVEEGYKSDDTKRHNSAKGKKKRRDDEEAEGPQEAAIHLTERTGIDKDKKAVKWRVYTSIEQRWKALTAHGIDHKKIPPKFFELLAEIGRHREEGILQPNLTKVTGQDARSVGPRTQLLAKMGYIEKVHILAAKLRTSRLTLTSFAFRRDLKEKELKKAAAEKGSKADKISANAAWTGDTVDVRKMVEAIFVELKKAKNQVLMHSDLKRKLGMDITRFHFRAFARIIRRVERTGCLRRIRVPLNINRHKSKRPTVNGLPNKCLARCIKLIREPDPSDWEETLKVIMRRIVEDDDEVGGMDEGDEDGEKDDDKADDAVDDDAVAKLESTEGELVEESARIVPKWVPDRTMENVIFEAVDSAGMEGISSMDLHQLVTGRFYYRPVDQILRRLGENPLQSQPPHLIHLAIIRETDIEGRHTHYRYFSYKWHEKLVAAGLGKPIGGPKKTHGKGKKKQKEKQETEDVPKRVTVPTDELGFPFVDKRRLLKADGSATLKEAQEKLLVPESEHVLKSKYIIDTTEEGQSSIRWASWNSITKRDPNDIPKKKLRPDGTPARRGRPPKNLSATLTTSASKRAPEGGDTPSVSKRALEDGNTPSASTTKKQKLDENGPPLPPKPRGRPRKAKKPPQNSRKLNSKPVVQSTPNAQDVALATEVQESVFLDTRDAGTAGDHEMALEDQEETQQAVAQFDQSESDLASAELDKTLEESNEASNDAVVLGEVMATPQVPTPKRKGRLPKYQKSAHSEPEPISTESNTVEEPSDVVEVNQTLHQTPAPKRRGRPPKVKPPTTPVTQAIDLFPTVSSTLRTPAAPKTPHTTTTRETRSKRKAANLPGVEKITEFYQPKSVSATELQTVEAEQNAPGEEMKEPAVVVPKRRGRKRKDVPVQEPTQPEVVDVEMLDASLIEQGEIAKPQEEAAPSVTPKLVPPMPQAVARAAATPSTTEDDPKTPLRTRKSSRVAQTWTSQRSTRRSEPFSASVDASAEVLELTSAPSPLTSRNNTAIELESETTEDKAQQPRETTPTISQPNTPGEGAFILTLKQTKGRMYRRNNSPGSSRQPRSEPSMVLEEVDDSARLSYGSAGGMLMIQRQRVIMELIEENGGVFPGGLEIKHAFECRYKRKNPKAGQPDRRLMVSLVSSLQRSGKINQIVINFINSRGLRQTKRILADAKLPLDSPLIMDMKNKIVAADGNLWFPEGTEIPKDAQKLASSVRGLPTQPGTIESVEFDRMYMPTKQLLKEQKAEHARDRLLRLEFPRFTAEQKELAAKRLEYRRRKRAYYDRLRLAAEDDTWDGEMDIENPEQTFWWQDFVDRPDVQALNDIEGFVPAPGLPSTVILRPPVGIPEPHKKSDFVLGVRDVILWEKRQIWWNDELDCYFGFNMINHFGPQMDLKETDFCQEEASMDHAIFAPDFRRGNRDGFSGWRRLGAPRKHARKALNFAEDEPRAKRRRIIGPLKKKRSRREKAMADLHRGGDGDDDPTLDEVPPKPAVIPRKRHLFDHDQDDILLGAIIIVRTLFGGFDRRIDWNLVWTAFPDVELATLKARWPRVRDAHKTHLKKLQIDFEETYLTAYEKGEMPEIKRGENEDFDLPWHTKWFRENVTVPDSKSVPTLPNSRKVFDSLYDLRTERPSWRDEFHNAALTGESRKTFLYTHAFEIPVIQSREDTRPFEDSPEQECLKSLIKANILTDITIYDARKAFGLLSKYEASKIDDAFYTLTGHKMLAPKKDAEKLVPGRNYEFTEKFHLSLRGGVGGRMWSQAVGFENLCDQAFHVSRIEEEDESPIGDGSAQEENHQPQHEMPNPPPVMQLSPIMNDGCMLSLLSLIANRRVTLDKSHYHSNIHGLIPGYRTRTIEKNLIDFPIFISPTPLYYQKPYFRSSPHSPYPPAPPPNSPDWDKQPVKLWYDIMGNIVMGMWKKCVAAVLGTVVARPGIREGEIVKVLWPGLTIVEVEELVGWLVECGAVDRVKAGDGVHGCFPREGCHWSLGLTGEKLGMV